MAIDEEAPAPASSEQPGLLAELGQFGRASKRLLGAQWELLLAEVGLARSAVWVMLVAGLAATVVGVGFGLSVLALVGVALAKWWGSWLWALFALAVFQLLLLFAAILIFRRCMHWLTLPRSRSHWATLIRDVMRPEPGPEPGPGSGPGPAPDRAGPGSGPESKARPSTHHDAGAAEEAQRP